MSGFRAFGVRTLSLRGSGLPALLFYDTGMWDMEVLIGVTVPIACVVALSCLESYCAFSANENYHAYMVLEG